MSAFPAGSYKHMMPTQSHSASQLAFDRSPTQLGRSYEGRYLRTAQFPSSISHEASEPTYWSKNDHDSYMGDSHLRLDALSCLIVIHCDVDNLLPNNAAKKKGVVEFLKGTEGFTSCLDELCTFNERRDVTIVVSLQYSAVSGLPIDRFPSQLRAVHPRVGDFTSKS